MNAFRIPLFAGLGLAFSMVATQAQTLLLREPSLSSDSIAFVYAGDIWVAGRQGQQPRQLTTHAASEFAPKFSPDGRWIAFSANYDNNTDVYVIPVQGGTPRRLTWHPGADTINGWSADGKRVLFASNREVANGRSNQLYEVPVDGGPERKLMQALAFEGAWAADGERLAYRPYGKAYQGVSGWRQSRGGTTPPIWILNTKTNQLDKIPHENASDNTPMWVGDEVVFISDRKDHAANLFAYNSKTKALRQLTRETVWDIRNASVQGQTVIYEAGGALKTLDLASGKTAQLNIALNANTPQTRVQWKDLSKTVTSVQLSATGKRVLVSARGEVFTVPAKEGYGSVRNLTQTAGLREKDALWSPDGKRVAFIAQTEANVRRHELVLVDQSGQGAREHHALAEGYFTLLDWAPDGKTLVLQDNHLKLYAYTLTTRQLKVLDRTPRRDDFEVAFSADSRWLAYTIQGANHFSQIRLYDFQTGQQSALSDGLSDATSPVFAPKGDVLYFTASVNTGPSHVGLDMSTQERPRRMGIYAAVLTADGKSPLAPRAGDEEGKKADAKSDAKAAAKPDAKASEPAADSKADKPPAPVRIDLVGLQQRLIALPVAERRYDSLAVASDGALLYLERRQRGISNEPPEADKADVGELNRFDFEERKAKSLKSGVTSYTLSADGKKLLLQFPKGKLEVADANEKLDAKPVDLSGLRARIDPRQEWRQIFDETWWMEQEFFYDPKLHGLDAQAVYQRYLPLLAHVQRREDLNELLVEMIGELQVGHNRTGGGDVHQEPAVSVGLLGVDAEPHQGRWRIAKIYSGDRWNPFLKAPLAVPGLGVKAGDYILNVNGQELTAEQNFFAAFENSVGKQLSLGIAASSKGDGLRQVVVEPVARDAGLRQWDWIEHNREAVDKKTGGRVAYVYLPDTGGNGYAYFNRMFYAQSDKEAVIVDDRRNGGGQAANYILDVLARPYLSGWKDRDALIYNTPGSAIYGPKAMLIDQDAGSGGDFLPWAFKRMGLGPLIGTRTWGGLIGISTNPPLIDGAFLSVPHFRFFTPDGEWRVENEGVAPDIEVELDPLAVNRGEDSQLDAAIANVMDQLKRYKPVDRKTAPASATLGK